MKINLLKSIFIYCLLATSQSNAQTLKVMTYNIRLDIASDGENAWSQRKDFFCSQIQFYEPNIMGVQEALPNQIQDLATNLSAYEHIGIGREGEGKGESSAIFYLKKRFKVSNNQTFWLSDTPDQISKGWDASYIRVCTYALFYDKKMKKNFWVFNTHLDNNGVTARLKGIDLILKKIQAVNVKKYPVILMGDFNTEPQTELLVNLKKEMADTRDVSEEKPFGPSGSFNGFKFSEPVTRLIDYIFVDKQSAFKVKKYAILSDSQNLKYPSDHLPVYVELKHKDK
jgi:endonuclease/exonuclease/phosphatase family metal-dependent hydrolase